MTGLDLVLDRTAAVESLAGFPSRDSFLIPPVAFSRLVGISGTSERAGLVVDEADSRLIDKLILLREDRGLVLHSENNSRCTSQPNYRLR